MDNAHDNSIAPGQGNPRETGITPLRSLFAEEAKPAKADSALPGADATVLANPRFNVLTRVVLPVAILLLGIAGLAWIVQFLPSRGVNRPVQQSSSVAVAPIRFEGRAEANGIVWADFFSGDETLKDYNPEYELGMGGHYDFPFINTTTADAELGILKTLCSCSGVEVCIFESGQSQEYTKAKTAKAGLDSVTAKLHWHKLEVDKDLGKSVRIPAQAAGLLRIEWRGTKTEPERLALGAIAWSRPAGTSWPGPTSDLRLIVKYVRPAMFDHERLELGSINPKDDTTARIMCWSATSDIDVKPASADKCLKVVVDKLDPKECQELQKRLREQKTMTHVQSAYKITLTLYEQREGKQLDMGALLRPVPLAIASNGQPVQVPLPLVKAFVRGPIFLLGGQEDGGRIDFKIFKAKQGSSKKVTLVSPKGAKLSFAGCDPSLVDLAVELKEVKTEGDKTQWEMDVTVKPDPDGRGFSLSEDSVLILECELPAVGSAPAVKRLARIPVVGTAGSH